MSNNVLFSRFLGSISKWEYNIEQHKWDNTIVFGKIWNPNTNAWEYKIYAGNVYSPESAENVNFIYDIPSKQELEDIKTSILNNTLKINDISVNLATINTSIGIIENSIQWVITEDN